MDTECLNVWAVIIQAMARVEIRPSGNATYAVVVDDFRASDGVWRKRVIGSFGNASDQNNVNRAHLMANAVNAGQSLLAAKVNSSEDDLVKALGLFVGAAIAGLAVAWLLGKR